ncbi:MAG: sulfite exporter TauE/SafE family protein [Hyphomicrobiaceae bacterium]
MAEVTYPAILLAAFGFLFAGLVKGATGLGFSTSCLPFLVLALGLDRAMPLILIPSLTSNLMVHVQAGEFRRTAQKFWPMFLALIPGLLLGLWLLSSVNLGYATSVLGAVLIAYATYTLLTPELNLPDTVINAARIPVGFLTGLVNGLTGSQIMPVLPYLLSQPLSNNVFLQTVNTSFTISSLIMMIGLSKIGFLTIDLLIISALALFPVFAGVNLGTKLRRRMTTDTFRKAVLMVLIGLGIILILKVVV